MSSRALTPRGTPSLSQVQGRPRLVSWAQSLVTHSQNLPPHRLGTEMDSFYSGTWTAGQVGPCSSVWVAGGGGGGLGQCAGPGDPKCGSFSACPSTPLPSPSLSLLLLQLLLTSQSTSLERFFKTRQCESKCKPASKMSVFLYPLVIP